MKGFRDTTWNANVVLMKYEEVYLNAYDTTKEARESIGEWIRFYNHERTHQALGRKTPEQVYLNSRSIKELAA